MEKKCKHCAMMIPREAKICPHCRKTQGISTGVGCLVILAVLFGIGMVATMVSKQQPKPVYTEEQKKEAEKYQNLLLNSGLVTQLKAEGSTQVVYVDRKMWNLGTFENKKLILKTLSQTNEMLGRTPWIEIRDHRSGKVYGALKPPLTMDIYE